MPRACLVGGFKSSFLNCTSIVFSVFVTLSLLKVNEIYRNKEIPVLFFKKIINFIMEKKFVLFFINQFEEIVTGT
jgi:hypothetical protein